MLVNGFGTIKINDKSFPFTNHVFPDMIPKFFITGFRQVFNNYGIFYRNPWLKLAELDETYNVISTAVSKEVTPSHTDEILDFDGFDYHTYKLSIVHEFTDETFINGLLFQTREGVLTSVLFNEVGVPNFNINPGDTVDVTYYIQVGIPSDPVLLGTIPADPDIDITIKMNNLHSRYSGYCFFVSDWRNIGEMEVEKVRLNWIGADHNYAKKVDNTDYTFQDLLDGVPMKCRFDNESTTDPVIISGVNITGYSSSDAMYYIDFSSDLTLNPGGYIEFIIQIDINDIANAYASMRIRVLDADAPQNFINDATVNIYDAQDVLLTSGTSDEDGFFFIGGLDYGELVFVEATDGVDTSYKYPAYINQEHLTINVLL